MKAHSVLVDRSRPLSTLTFADTFNVTVPFLDKHLEEGRGERVVARWRDKTLTIAEIASGAARMANALRRLGVGPGDRVMLFCKDSPSFYYGFLGTVRLGAVAVPVNYFLRAADYSYMLGDSKAKVVLATKDVLPELEPALASPGSAVEHRICADANPPGWIAMDDLLAAETDTIAPAPTTATSDMFWLYSSGSTGAPKASVHQHKDMVYTSELYAVRVAGIGANDVMLSPPKLFFAYGIGNSLSFPLWTGAPVVLLEERPTAQNTLDLITWSKPTVYFGVPTLYAMQVAALEQGHKADLSSLRWCVSGGEALPPPVYEGWKRLTGLEILDAIGSSEALHLYTSNLPGSVRLGSAGRMVAGYEGRICDENFNDVPDGEPGQFAIRGASVATYYWNKPEKTAQQMRGGWFFTGDTCWRDADGYYFFSGRDDDMLKVGGIWVSPFEVESALAAHPAVMEAAVIGAPDENGLIKPKGFVVLKPGGRADDALRADLVAFVRGRLAPFKYPRWVEFVDELPKTASGKIQRFRLRTLTGGR